MSTNTTDNYNREDHISPKELGELCLDFVGLSLGKARTQGTSRNVRQFFAELAGDFLSLSRLAGNTSLSSNTEEFNDVIAQVKYALAKYERVAHPETALALVGGNTPHIGRYSVFGDKAAINQVSDKSAAINQVTPRGIGIGRNNRGG